MSYKMTPFEQQFQYHATREPLWVGLVHLAVLWGLLAVFMWAVTL